MDPVALEHRLHWSTNKESYVAYRMAPLPMHWNDFEAFLTPITRKT